MNVDVVLLRRGWSWFLNKILHTWKCGDFPRDSCRTWRTQLDVVPSCLSMCTLKLEAHNLKLIVHIEALSLWRKIQRWRRSVFNDHWWWTIKYVVGKGDYVAMEEKEDLSQKKRTSRSLRGVERRTGVARWWAWPWPDHLEKTHTLRVGVLYRLLRWHFLLW